MDGLTQEEVISIVFKKLRLIRSEYNFSQDRLAEVLGISKKTLIQIEKERMEAYWTLVIAVCGLFRESEILKMVLGDDPVELIETIVFKNMATPKNITGGGKAFWRDISVEGKFKLQKNILTSHYRIIDGNNRRWYSSFDKDYILKEFQDLLEGGKDSEEEIE